MEVKVYSIDDKDYYLVDEVEDEGNNYLALSNKDDEDDILFRKVDGDSLIPLESEEEFGRVLQLFDNK